MADVVGREVPDVDERRLALLDDGERPPKPRLVVLTDIYASGTVPIPGVTGKLIVNAVTETVSGSLTTALKGTGSVGRALTDTAADVASGVVRYDNYGGPWGEQEQ